jgi:small redox-active disulfide protein 2
MKIEVLGVGCPKCQKTYERVKEAIRNTGVAAELVKVKEIGEMAKFGIIGTPAVAIDGEVKAAGKVPSADQIASWIAEAQGEETER